MDKVIRWEPRDDLLELPFSAFDLTWTADRSLTCEAYYGATVPKAYRGVRIRFDEVHAFASFDGFSDPLISYQTGLVPLREPVAYGGKWPFAEVRVSSWMIAIINADAVLDVEYWRHLAITTFDQTLHVMSPRECAPQAEFWLHTDVPEPQT